MVRALSKTKTGKMNDPKFSPTREKNQKFRRALEGARTEEITDFETGGRVSWGMIYHELSTTINPYGNTLKGNF